MKGHEHLSDDNDQTDSVSGAGPCSQMDYLSWRRHPLSGPLTRTDWLVMLYGVVSGPVYMYSVGTPVLTSVLIGGFVGLFLMLMLVGVTKVLLIWEYMRIPMVLVSAVRILLVGFLALALVAAAANGDWPFAAALTWVLLPLLFLFCYPKPSA